MKVEIDAHYDDGSKTEIRFEDLDENYVYMSVKDKPTLRLSKNDIKRLAKSL